MENLDFFSTSAKLQIKSRGKNPNSSSLNVQRELLHKKFSNRLIINKAFDRALVSFQANRLTPIFNWFKYREGFSSKLVRYLIGETSRYPGTLLDPFSGAGTTLFEGASSGWSTLGIELLPVGIFSTNARLTIKKVNPDTFKKAVHAILKEDFKKFADAAFFFKHIPITQGAFSSLTEDALSGYQFLIHKKYKNDPEIFTLLNFAAFCILEDISFTRKDGQYLRWDYRANRTQGKSSFNKGQVLSFQEAITAKLHQMIFDLENREEQQQYLFEEKISNKTENHVDPKIYQGSCLKILPTLPEKSIDLMITSPPYCNRYDYTRTYALELAYLGLSADEVKELRQALLSCTVENKEKVSELKSDYSAINRPLVFEEVKKVFDSQLALQEILTLLDRYAKSDALNNPNIARMVRNYFFEMGFTIKEMSRLLANGGKAMMVNDNVQYAGEEIPVDLILSDFAESFGLTCEVIWILPRGKGNSSQQMSQHGRTELRKCVYVWSKK